MMKRLNMSLKCIIVLSVIKGAHIQYKGYKLYKLNQSEEYKDAVIFFMNEEAVDGKAFDYSSCSCEYFIIDKKIVDGKDVLSKRHTIPWCDYYIEVVKTFDW